MKVDIDTSDKLYADAWLGFKGTDWKNEINVRDFIPHNYTPYEGDESFLAEATPATTELWEKVMERIRIENATPAPLDFDTTIATTITAHDAGYIDQPLEKIVWLGFKGTDWKNEINVRDFIQHNYTPYEGDESFLAEATPATTELWEKVMEGIRIENATHAPLDFDTNIATTITAHDAGYINQPLEKIVGLQTDAPLKRALHPFGGINMIRSSFHAYGREMDSEFEYIFTDLRKTHNKTDNHGVFETY